MQYKYLLRFQKKLDNGTSLSSWLSSPGTVYMICNVYLTKYETLLDEVELVKDNPNSANIRLPNGTETNYCISLEFGPWQQLWGGI